MTAAGSAPLLPRKGELRIVGTSVSREIESLLDRLAEAVGRRAPRVLQVGSRPSVSDRNERNWRALLTRRFGQRTRFIGIDLVEGDNVDRLLDICAPVSKARAVLGDEPFDLIVCCHVLEHTKAPARAARNIQALLRPGGLAYLSTPWSQAFHAAPDDYWSAAASSIWSPAPEPSSRACSSWCWITPITAACWPSRSPSGCRYRGPICRPCSSIWRAAGSPNEKSGLAPALSSFVRSSD
jgi:SAM-dependent methyltransferase